MKVVIHPTSDEVASAVADRIATSLAEAENGYSLGLSGGSTPIPTYRSLAGRKLDWGRAQLWLSDERWVPPDHERSNGRMAVETLTDATGAALHRPKWTEHLQPEDSAVHYEAEIRAIHHDRRPDMIHLGMGADGHTASLFPETSALEPTSRWIVANHVPSLPEARITATFTLLWSARTLLVQVEGAAKAQAVFESMEGRTPAGRLAEGDAEVEWHLDEPAAALIS